MNLICIMPYLIFKKVKSMIRLATLNDLPSIMEIIKDAKELLKKSGSSQWNTSDGYPTKETIITDIKKQQLFVYEDTVVIGTMTCSVGEDPNYKHIEGKWITDSMSYITIHRIAVKKEYYHKGIAKALLHFAKRWGRKQPATSIRLDTHPLNIPMQNLVKQQGFTYCGTIQLLNRDDNLRLAYEQNLWSYDRIEEAKIILEDLEELPKLDKTFLSNPLLCGYETEYAERGVLFLFNTNDEVLYIRECFSEEDNTVYHIILYHKEEVNYSSQWFYDFDYAKFLKMEYADRLDLIRLSTDFAELLHPKYKK